MIARYKRGAWLVALVALVVTLAACAITGAAEPPVANKFVFSGRFGSEVDGTTGGSICTVASKDECRSGKFSEAPGGFIFPETVAVAPNGDVYVGDEANHSIQELTADGEFVLMFGWNVNKTKVAEGAPQAARDVCSAAEVKSGANCLAGEEGTGRAGQMTPVDVAVDQTTGNVYELDSTYHRVQEFTSNGEFVLMIGGEVNETKDKEPGAAESEKNLCTAASGDDCKAGVRGASVGTAHGAFVQEEAGNVLAVGGPEDLLYVGDEGRVQEFDADGKWKQDISLTSISSVPESKVSALAVAADGDVYLVYGPVSGQQRTTLRRFVHEFHADGQQFAEFEVLPKDPNTGLFEIFTLGLDVHSRLAITEVEEVKEDGFSATAIHGALYSTDGTKLSEIVSPAGHIAGGQGIAFAPSDALYVAEAPTQSIAVYAPVVFPEASVCTAERVAATSATLCGEINPNGLFTRGLFAYGPPTGAQTPIAFEGVGTTLTPVHWQLTGLVPNQTYQYKALAEAEAAGEQLQAVSETSEFHTDTPPVEILGEPSVSFVRAQAAVLNASLNPEHATTHYHFEYGPCPALAGCLGAKTTPEAESSQYGKIGFTQEVRGLAAQTTYRYRLVASNEHAEGAEVQGGQGVGAEGVFTTGAPPVVEAFTGPASAVTSTGALISGTVNPDGQPATYAFELGVYAGAGTQYGVVSSGSAGAGIVPVEQSLELAGLQPGAVYAYRIVVRSGYSTATGQAATFTTAGLPGLLLPPSVLPQLPVPSIKFPTAGSKHVKARKTSSRQAEKHKRPKRPRKGHRRGKQRGKGARQR